MLSKSERWEIIQRLRVARKKAQEIADGVFMVRDLDPGTELAAHWPAITLAYSGLEQSFKYLAAIEQQKPIREMRRRYDNQGHNTKSY